MASIASSATTGGARKHAWTNSVIAKCKNYLVYCSSHLFSHPPTNQCSGQVRHFHTIYGHKKLNEMPHTFTIMDKLFLVGYIYVYVFSQSAVSNSEQFHCSVGTVPMQ